MDTHLTPGGDEPPIVLNVRQTPPLAARRSEAGAIPPPGLDDRERAGDALPGQTLPVAPASSSRDDSPLSSDASRAKVVRIEAACHDADLQLLADLASSESGLVLDELRRLAWPILLGCNSAQARSASKSEWSLLPRHRDEDQVDLDVNRSFVYYPENESPQRLDQRKSELSDVITAVLRQHPKLCYFQGYHDIVQVLLLVLGADATAPAIARLSLLRIRDFMLPTLTAAESHLHLIPAILYAADQELYRHLSGATQPTPFFALAATLTLYAHDIEEYGDIARLFDYLLASEAVVPVYLFAVIIMSRKKELLEIDHGEPEMLHSILSKLPKPLDLEGLIRRTRALFEQFPPEKLPNWTWMRISPHSVLKTTRDPHTLARQTLEYGEQLFDKQAAEIRRQEQIKLLRQRTHALAVRYRRPIRWTSAAVLVALLAYMGRSTASVSDGSLAAVFSALRQRAFDFLQQFARH